MSIYLTPVTFENQHITPSDDGAAWASAISDGILTGCEITKSGASLSIAAGKIVACGRVCRANTLQTVQVTGSSGYARLVLTIDKSKPVEQQVAIDVQYANTIESFSALTKQDVNNDGTIYQMALCFVDLSGSGSITWTCGKAHGKAIGVAVTLSASGWNSGEQTVFVDGITTESNIICTYSIQSKSAFLASDVDAIAQGNGWVTFSANPVPNSDITAMLLIL
jgi:hypothetical protein